MLSKLFEVTRALKTAGKVTAAQLKDLRVWLLAGKDLDDKDRATIDDVTA
jgi:hypothetical protein